MHNNVWEFTGLCWWSMVEQYAMTSKTFRESNTVNQIFTVDQVSLLLPILSLFSIYHKVFLGIHFYQPLKHCTIIIILIKYFKGFDLSELYNLQQRIPNLKHSIVFWELSWIFQNAQVSFRKLSQDNSVFIAVDVRDPFPSLLTFHLFVYF